MTWVDVSVGDFDGDGNDDLAGRTATGGEWWVAKSNGTDAFVNQYWVSWSTAVTWNDVSVGDFNGDGSDDLAGRTASGGEWWVAKSSGSDSFLNEYWGLWDSGMTWLEVLVDDFAP